MSHNILRDNGVLYCTKCGYEGQPFPELCHSSIHEEVKQKEFLILQNSLEIKKLIQQNDWENKKFYAYFSVWL